MGRTAALELAKKQGCIKVVWVYECKFFIEVLGLRENGRETLIRVFEDGSFTQREV